MPDAPASTTPHFGLGQWNDGENPGASALNNNWTICDTEIFSASQTTLTYSLPLEKTGTNLSLNLGNNVRLVGSNLETIQNIRTTDAPGFEGINVWEPSIAKQFFMPKGSSICYLAAHTIMVSGSTLLIGTQTTVGHDLTYTMNVTEGSTRLGGDTLIGENRITSRHVVTGSTYITGSFFSVEGGIWSRGDTVWGKLLARGETYVSGNSYFGEKMLSNGPLYLAPGIVSASNPPNDNTASWEDTFQTSQDRADTEQIALDGNVIPDPDPENDLMLYVSGNSFFKGQVEIQGGFTSSNGAFNYDANTGQMTVTSLLISGSEEISIDTDTGDLVLGSAESTSSFGAISVTTLTMESLVYSGSEDPAQDEASQQHLVLHSEKQGLVSWASSSNVSTLSSSQDVFAGGTSAYGLVMRSPDGTSWRLSVNDSGVVSASSI